MSEPVERAIPQATHSYYDIYVPDGPAVARPLLIAMHGYAGDKASMMRAARRVAGDDFVVASLQGIHQHIVYPEDGALPLKFGFGWVTNFKPEESIALHHHAVDAIVDGLVGDGIADPSRVFLLGFSQASAVNFRYAFTHGGRVRGVVAICGGIPSDWAGEGKYERADLDVLYVAGREDAFYPPDRIERYAEALRQRARSVEVRFYDVGHVWPREANPDVAAWLAARV